MTQALSPKVPPQALDAEKCVLGAILLDPEAINNIIDLIQDKDFYKKNHQTIYDCMLSLFDRSEPIDVISLGNELKLRQALDKIGGPAYLGELAAVVPSSANIGYYAKLVHEKALLRNLISASNVIVEAGYEGATDVGQILDAAERSIFELSEKKSQKNFFPVREIIKDSFKDIEAAHERGGGLAGISTGFKDLDRLTSGLQGSDLIIIAGRPAMGKTAFVLNVAHAAATQSKKPVAVFSLEMSKESLVNRLLCCLASVDAMRLKTGQLREADWPKLTRAASQLSETPMFIDDTPEATILEIRAKCRRMMREEGLGAVVIDYLQLMRGHRNEASREREISEISRGLKALAKELNIPVVALSQLNRSLESRQDKRPMLSDLRESGAIEQDADIIMFIYRDEVYNPMTPEPGVAEVIVGKHRNGATGVVRLKFFKEYTRFDDLEENLDELMPAQFANNA